MARFNRLDREGLYDETASIASLGTDCSTTDVGDDVVAPSLATATDRLDDQAEAQLGTALTAMQCMPPVNPALFHGFTFVFPTDAWVENKAWANRYTLQQFGAATADEAGSPQHILVIPIGDQQLRPGGGYRLAAGLTDKFIRFRDRPRVSFEHLLECIHLDHFDPNLLDQPLHPPSTHIPENADQHRTHSIVTRDADRQRIGVIIEGIDCFFAASSPDVAPPGGPLAQGGSASIRHPDGTPRTRDQFYAYQDKADAANGRTWSKNQTYVTTHLPIFESACPVFAKLGRRKPGKRPQRVTVQSDKVDGAVDREAAVGMDKVSSRSGQTPPAIVLGKRKGRSRTGSTPPPPLPLPPQGGHPSPSLESSFGDQDQDEGSSSHEIKSARVSAETKPSKSRRASRDCDSGSSPSPARPPERAPTNGETTCCPKPCRNQLISSRIPKERISNQAVPPVSPPKPEEQDTVLTSLRHPTSTSRDQDGEEPYLDPSAHSSDLFEGADTTYPDGENVSRTEPEQVDLLDDNAASSRSTTPTLGLATRSPTPVMPKRITRSTHQRTSTSSPPPSPILLATAEDCTDFIESYVKRVADDAAVPEGSSARSYTALPASFLGKYLDLVTEESYLFSIRNAWGASRPPDKDSLYDVDTVLIPVIIGGNWLSIAMNVKIQRTFIFHSEAIAQEAAGFLPVRKPTPHRDISPPIPSLWT
ncbi:hypothetical protein IAU60_006933 [Kwoniella sp. DSM 27419]